jgi:hypothetical protein
MDIKPIETVYKGYRFRSRLEARWAVFFDALGIEWEYEKEGYDLGEAGWYLPDFWLPRYQCWVEIKPRDLTGSEASKAQQLSARNPVFTLGKFEDKGFTGFKGDKNAVYLFHICTTCGALSFIHLMDGARERREFRAQSHVRGCDCVYRGHLDRERLNRAFDAARSARFEHGESGA